MNDLMKTLESLVKTLEAGNYNQAPGQLVQGSAFQIENLDPVMQIVTRDDSDIKLQKAFTVKKTKSIAPQFVRKLSHGRFGGSAQREGAVGDLNVGDWVRIQVPMCFYACRTAVTLVANHIDTMDGVKAEDRVADDAASKLADDIEFDSFKGKADFSNNGVFDGNPLAIPELPNMMGVDNSIRMSDLMQNTQDLMFASYGSNRSVVLSKNGALDQPIIEDAALRSRMNHGKAKDLFVDPVILSGYNKAVALGTGANSIQRIVLAGSAQDASGADLRRQWVSGNTVSIDDSRYLSGKTAPNRAMIGAPAAPATASGSATGSGALIPAGTHFYVVTSENERGEGVQVNSSGVVVTTGQRVDLTIAGVAGASFYNVYRGLSVNTAYYIGRVKADGSNSVVFTDLGNKAPGFVTGYLVQQDSWNYFELMPYSRLKTAIQDLSIPEAHFRWLTLAPLQPRKNVICDNLF